MEIAQKKVLVTGAGGFIGSHLIEALLQMNCEVKAFIHYNSFGRWGWLDYFPKSLMKYVEVFTGDIRDPNGMTEAMKGNSIVFDVYVDTNVRGTLNVLQSARNLEIEKVVHTSTSEVYGTAQFVPITEEHPVNPQSPYAATKAGADFLALTFYRSFNTPVAVVRPFNTYGPRQSARAIIPTIITQILSGQKKITLGSLSPTRDLSFVKDTVRGFIKAGESDLANGEVINLGSNYEISIGDLAYKIAGILDQEITIETADVRKRPGKSEVERLWASGAKASNILNWEPIYSLDQGLAETIDWFRKPGISDLYKPELYNI
jgi:NAD dependent epimerase/dehydratase